MRRFPFFFFLLLISCLWPGRRATAQTLPVFQKTYTTENGLCDNAITAIETDTNGFLWLATRNGLARYDGVRFKNYYQSPDGGLRSNWITDLERDRLGVLWVSTEWGLCRYDARHDRFQYINPAGQLVILYKAPLKADKAFLWAAATDGLWRVDLQTNRLAPTRLRKIGDPQCLELDGHGHLFIGTRGSGLLVYDIPTDTYRSLVFPPLTPASHCMDMCRKDGFVWVATDAGLLRIDSQLRARLFNTLKGNKEGAVEALMTAKPFALTRPGDIVCGSYDRQLYLFNTQAGVFTQKLVSAEKLAPLSKSPYLCSKAVGGVLWMGAEAGLSLLDPTRREIALYALPQNPGGMEDAFVAAAMPAADGQELWLQTREPASLLRYDPQAQRTLQQYQLADDQPKAATQHFLWDGNAFWLSCGNMLQKRAADGALLRHFSLPFTLKCLALAPGNRLCAGTDKGVAFVDKKTGETNALDIPFKSSELEEKSGPEAFMATGIFVDSVHQTVWVSSIKYGLFCVSATSGNVRAFRQPVTHQYNARNRCASLLADSQGNLWLGTMDGLTRFDTTRKTFYNYRASAHKVPNYTYYTAFDSLGNLWCRSNEGVFCKRAGSDVFVFYPLSPELLNGYLYQQPTAYGASGIAMGYDGGLALFRLPDSVPRGRLPLLITACKTPDSSYFINATDGKLTIRYPQNSLNIEFATPVFGEEGDLRYEYRMLGRDTAFKPAPQQQLLYTNLPGGDYVFEVRGSLPGYLPGKARLYLTVIPPFRETIWARLLLLGAIAGAIYGFYRYRLHQVHREQAFRNRIGRNLHDEMGATLSSINIYSEVGRHSTANDKAQQLFAKISAGSAALQESVSDIIWYIHSKENTLQDVLLRLQDFAVPLLEARNIAYAFETDREAAIPLPPRYREHLYLIFKEALNNSLKYAEPQSIQISFLKEGKSFVCRFQDDGKGFDAAAAKRGNGLRNMQERAAMMKGTLAWNAALGKGFEMVLTFGG